MADLSSENVKWHLSQEYGCALFSGRSEASRWYMTVGALPMSPVAEMTSGVKGPCSTSLTLSLYFLLYSFSCLLYTDSGVELVLLGAKGLNTHTSKNAL